MKLALLATFTLLPFLAMAQDTTNAPSAATPAPTTTLKSWRHQFSTKRQLAMLTDKLSLTEDQQAQIKPILVSRNAKAKAVYGDSSLTPDQKHAQIKPIFESSNKEIEALLKSDQVTLFEALHQQHHADAKPAAQAPSIPPTPPATH
jgi:Spy/CpxP family protein refolding chaperone